MAITELTTRDSGIKVIGRVPWGSHFCMFYDDEQDLVDLLVPYFKAGLEQNEFCMWITSEPLQAEHARAALATAIPNLDEYLKRGQIEILDYRDWYVLEGRFDSERVLQGWVDKLAAAQARGFAGLRLSGNTFWLEPTNWRDFTDYEAAVDAVIGQYQMLAMCTYSLAKCGAVEIMEVVSNHVFALIRRGDRWQVIESAERRKMEESLRLSEERYRNLFTSMTEGFALHEIIVDEAGLPCDYRFLEVNPAFERLTGLTRDRVIGRTMWEVLPGSEPFWVETYGKVALTGESLHFENYSSPLDRWYEVFAYSPAPGQFAVLFGDITERKRVEHERERLLEQMQTFMHMVSHDLRAPLTAIGGNAQMLRLLAGSQGNSPALEEVVDSIYRGVRRMDTMISDLLDVARLEGGRLALNPVPTDLAAYLPDLVKRLGLVLEMERVAVRLAPGLPPAATDPDRLERILTNLCSNALKYSSPATPVVITAEPREGEVVVSVCDQGQGISERALPHVFDRFYRAPEGRRAEGIGLGLYITRLLVEAQGGRIWVESTPGKGSTFSFTLPLADVT